MKSISLFFPVYGDEGTVEIVTESSLEILKSLSIPYEILIVNDCSPDRSGEIADQLSEKHEHVKVIHHEINKNYGGAIQTGLNAAKYEWICFLDGDNQYHADEFLKLFKVAHNYDLIITFRYRKIYSTLRIFISWVYNLSLRYLFSLQYRDISTGLRMIKKEVSDDLNLTSSSAFIGAEMTIKAMLKGYSVGEVGIQTFPRTFGESSVISLSGIISTIKDMLRIRKEVFSDTYDIAENSKKFRSQ